MRNVTVRRLITDILLIKGKPLGDEGLIGPIFPINPFNSLLNPFNFHQPKMASFLFYSV